MSELDTKLAELRDGLRARLSRPDLGDVAVRARQRTVRRRMQLGAVAAVVVVSVAIPVLRSMPSPQRPPADPPVATEVTYEVDFADADRGFALRGECAEDSCEFTLLVTTDGGRNWQPRALPDGDRRYVGIGLTVLSSNELTINRATAEDQRYLDELHSDDAGRTWHVFAIKGAGDPAPLPRGTRIQQVCVNTKADDTSTGPGCVSGVGVMQPDKRWIAPAPGQPPNMDPLRPGPVATEGGRFWAAGRDLATGQWAITVSSDAGATWTTTPLEVPGETWPIAPWSVVEQGADMYATALGTPQEGPLGLLAVYRSTDHGLTWTRTWQWTPETSVPAVLGSPVATWDGRLLVYSTTEGTLESSDGGRTFTKASRQLLGEVAWTRAGYLATGKDGTYALSGDGINWRTFRLP
jgi:photosystem II stability/assembly factor-like uncharacterized protein